MANKGLAPHLCLCLLHVDEESSSERRGHCLGSHSDRSAEADPGSSGLDALGGSRFGGRVLGRSCCSTWQSSMLSAVAAIPWSLGDSHPPQCPLCGSNGAPQRSLCKQGDEVPHAWILGDPLLKEMGHEISQVLHSLSSAHLSQPPWPLGAWRCSDAARLGRRLGCRQSWCVPKSLAPICDPWWPAQGKGTPWAGLLGSCCCGGPLPIVLPPRLS